MELNKNAYGLIKGTFFNEIDAENRSRPHRGYPHYNFEINAGGLVYEVNVNVFSRVKDHPELRVLATSDPDKDLINKAPLEKAIALQDGVYQNPDATLALDYLRGNYFALNRFTVPFEPIGEEEETFLMNLLKTHIILAQQNGYRFCIWGSLYHDDSASDDRKGIHDVHMNQGSEKPFENSIWQDGALIITDDREIKFACFLGFSSQCLATDDNGNCISK